MKKNLILLAIATAAFVSCSKETALVEMPEQVGHDEIVATKTITFSATVEQDDTDSKATISSASNFTWQSTDEVAVMTAKGNKVTLHPSAISGGSATFTATINADDSIADGAIVVFPACFMNASGQIVLPDSYGDLSETVGPYLAAEVQAGRSTLAFKYFAGAMRIHITDLPLYTTSIVVNMRNKEDNADVISTGTFSIAFSGTGASRVPVLTGGSGNTITINNGTPVYGDQTIVLPIPTAGEQKVSFYFKKGDDVLRTVSTTKTFARNTFMSMADLTLVSGVYFKGAWTNWAADEVGKMTAGAGNTYTYPAINYYPNHSDDSGKKYFKYFIKFGSTFKQYGPTSNQEVPVAGQTYNWWWNEDYSAYLDIPGVYNFSYNAGTNAFSISRSRLALYPETTFGDAPVLGDALSTEGHYQYLLGIQNDFKLVYDTSWDHAIGKNGSNWTDYPTIGGTKGDNKFSASSTNFASIVIDDNTGKYYYWQDGENTASSFSKLYIKGSWDDFKEGIEMTKSTSHNHIWTLSHTFEANQTFKVTDGADAWWGFASNMEVVYDNVVQGPSNDNLKVTVAGTYFIMFNDMTNKYHIIKTS